MELPDEEFVTGVQIRVSKGCRQNVVKSPVMALNAPACSYYSTATVGYITSHGTP